MLNPQQQQAVKTTEGPVRIIAGAGTGKTHTLISRIAYLIKEKRIQPEKILALTFTNKAAHELSERLRKKELPSVHAMTFHALAARLLRKFWNPDLPALPDRQAGGRQGFKILSQKEQEEILKEIIGKREDWKEVALEIEKMRINEVLNTSEGGESILRLQAIIDQYHEQLADRNALDFTGLLTTLLDLWKKRPEILKECQSLYLYILVDEYQDVNALQIKIVQKLSGLYKNICVVGDPDQTIYSWRGSYAQSMMEFESLYPDTTSITLTKNYRNPPEILKGAEKLIAHNPQRVKKELEPTVNRINKITFWESESAYQQHEMLFHLLEKLIGSHSDMHMADQLDVNRKEDFGKLNDIAILYRTQGEGKKFNAELSKRGYPCQMSAPESFWEKRVIVEFLEGIENLKQWSDIESGQKFSKWIREKINKFIESQELTKAKINRLNHLISYCMAFDHLPINEALTQFLDETRMEQEADNLIQADKINLLTLHAAKGLEFPIVLILGLEEGNLPHKKLMDDPYWLAEERRLFYVGMTRATEQLHIFSNKKKEGKNLERSRFLNEIGSENLVPEQLPEIKIRQIKKREIKKAQMKLF